LLIDLGKLSGCVIDIPPVWGSGMIVKMNILTMAQQPLGHGFSYNRQRYLRQL